MYKKTLLSAVVLSAILGVTMLSPVFAADDTDTGTDVTDTGDTDTGTDVTDAGDTDAGDTDVTDADAGDTDTDVTDGDRKFDDSALLEETLIGWQEEKVTTAEQDLADAQTALENAPEDATEDDLAALQTNVDDAQTALDDATTGLEEEKTKLTEQIAELSEEQIFALNRSLNNATHNGLIVDLNSEYMQDLLDGDYNKQQINSLTKALEEEAKFDKLADKFTLKAEETGNDKFLAKADMMSTKGDMQKDKFLAKVDKFGSDSDTDTDSDSLEVKQRSRIEKAMRDTARDTARGASKNSAKNDARKAAKTNAKKVAKERGREKAKSNNGKDKV